MAKTIILSERPFIKFFIAMAREYNFHYGKDFAPVFWSGDSICPPFWAGVLCALFEHGWVTKYRLLRIVPIVSFLGYIPVLMMADVALWKILLLGILGTVATPLAIEVDRKFFGINGARLMLWVAPWLGVFYLIPIAAAAILAILTVCTGLIISPIAFVVAWRRRNTEETFLETFLVALGEVMFVTVSLTLVGGIVLLIVLVCSSGDAISASDWEVVTLATWHVLFWVIPVILGCVAGVVVVFGAVWLWERTLAILAAVLPFIPRFFAFVRERVAYIYHKICPPYVHDRES
jgi:hypothetical protein